MSQSSRKITQTFNGRAEWQIGGAGFFKLLLTANPVNVELYSSGRQVLLAEQEEGGFYQRIAFDRVVITTGALESVSFMFAPNEGGSDRFTGNVVVTSGSIDVTDRAARLLGKVNGIFADAVTIAGEAFFGGAQSALNAGNFSHVQLKNPAASGKVLYLDRLHCNLSVAQNLHLRRHDVDCTTNSGQAANKDLGGAVPAGQVRIQNVTAAVLGTLISELASVTNGIPNVPVPFAPPVRIGAGEGILITAGGTGVGIFAHYEWRELPA